MPRHHGGARPPRGIPQSGLVPGITEWEYYFHGKGCCLTHRGSGQTIDVDFFGPTGEYFDFFFYLRYLQSLQDPEPPERVSSPCIAPRADRLAVRELLGAGMSPRSKKLVPVPPRRAGARPRRGHRRLLPVVGAGGPEGLARGPHRRLAIRPRRGPAHGRRGPHRTDGGPGRGVPGLASRELLAHWSDEDRRGTCCWPSMTSTPRPWAGNWGRALEGPIGGTTSRPSRSSGAG